MGNGNELDGIKIATGVIVVLLAVTLVFLLVKVGMRQVNKGSASIETTMNSMGDSSKQVYDGMTIGGSEVVNCINSFYGDTNMQIVVSTKAGSTVVVYTKRGKDEIFGSQKYKVSGFPVAAGGTAAIDLSNAENYKYCSDYNYDQASGSIKIVNDNGYNALFPSGQNGYINPDSKFLGSVQKDENGVIRCITFVEQ